METYFHGTCDKDFDATSKNPKVDCFDLCLTGDKAIAQMYAEDRADGSGDDQIFAVTIDAPAGSLADEEVATEIACDVWGVDSLTGFFLFEALDDPAVMEAILDAGFVGVEFVDQCPEAFEEHDTVRIYDASVVVGQKKV